MTSEPKHDLAKAIGIALAAILLTAFTIARLAVFLKMFKWNR